MEGGPEACRRPSNPVLPLQAVQRATGARPWSARRHPAHRGKAGRLRCEGVKGVSGAEATEAGIWGAK